MQSSFLICLWFIGLCGQPMKQTEKCLTCDYSLSSAENYEVSGSDLGGNDILTNLSRPFIPQRYLGMGLCGEPTCVYTFSSAENYEVSGLGYIE